VTGKGSRRQERRKEGRLRDGKEQGDGDIKSIKLYYEM